MSIYTREDRSPSELNIVLIIGVIWGLAGTLIVIDVFTKPKINEMHNLIKRSMSKNYVGGLNVSMNVSITVKKLQSIKQL